MDIRTNFIEVNKTARYSTFGEFSADTRYFWFALHGSKMLCEQMVYKFEDFDPKEHFVVAPEGLSRFYATGFGGEVVSTWMTKRDRINEIADFSNYLSKLYNFYSEKLNSGCSRVILGFSQGGTTAFRWFHRDEVKADHIIAYSCWIPEDIDLKMSESNIEKMNLVYTYGQQDQYLTDDRIKMVEDIINKNELKPNLEPYPGDHRISKHQLINLFEKYILSNTNG